MPKLIQVYFRKSPTGAFKLAYHANEFGWVRPQMAKALLDAGFIDPVSIVEPTPEPDYVPSANIEQPEVMLPDLSTVKGVKEVFGTDVQAMREYCNEIGLKIHSAVKRPETFWKKIAKHAK